MNVGLMTPAELAIEDTLRELRKLGNTGVDTEAMIWQLEAMQGQLRERITAKRANREPELFGALFANAGPSALRGVGTVNGEGTHTSA